MDSTPVTSWQLPSPAREAQPRMFFWGVFLLKMGEMHAKSHHRRDGFRLGNPTKNVAGKKKKKALVVR